MVASEDRLFFERSPDRIRRLVDLAARFEAARAADLAATDKMLAANREAAEKTGDPDQVAPDDHPAVIEARATLRDRDDASYDLCHEIDQSFASAARLGDILYVATTSGLGGRHHVHRINLALESDDVIFLDPLPE